MTVPPRTPLRDLHVLVVDDNEDTRDLLSRLLSFSGAFVTAVASADAAVNILRQIHPNVIVSDLFMPRHDGYWLMRRVRTLHAERPGIPGIAITAYRETEPEHKAFEAGYTAYLEKPLDFPRLIATIRRVAGASPLGDP